MRRWVGVAIRAVLGVIFLYAGLIKASSSQQFALGLVPFTFLPTGLTGLLAVAIAWSEVVAGVLILLPRVYLVGAAMIGGLVLIFITALSWALWNGIIIPCSCFGDGADASAEAMLMALVRDVFILGGVVVLAWLSKREQVYHPLREEGGVVGCSREQVSGSSPDKGTHSHQRRDCGVSWE